MDTINSVSTPATIHNFYPIVNGNTDNNLYMSENAIIPNNYVTMSKMSICSSADVVPNGIISNDISSPHQLISENGALNGVDVAYNGTNYTYEPISSSIGPPFGGENNYKPEHLSPYLHTAIPMAMSLNNINNNHTITNLGVNNECLYDPSAIGGMIQLNGEAYHPVTSLCATTDLDTNITAAMYPPNGIVLNENLGLITNGESSSLFLPAGPAIEAIPTSPDLFNARVHTLQTLQSFAPADMIMPSIGAPDHLIALTTCQEGIIPTGVGAQISLQPTPDVITNNNANNNIGVIGSGIATLKLSSPKLSANNHVYNNSESSQDSSPFTNIAQTSMLPSSQATSISVVQSVLPSLSQKYDTETDDIPSTSSKGTTSYAKGSLTNTDDNTIVPNIKKEEEFPSLVSAKPHHANQMNQNNIEASQSSKSLSSATKHMALKSSNVTQVVVIPLHERRFKNMPSALTTWEHFNPEQQRVCAEIMSKSGAHLELQNNQDHSLTIMITGKVKTVEEAKKLIAQQLQTQCHAEIHVEKEYHPVILGKGGSKLRSIEEECGGIKIAVPPKNSDSTLIRITGDKHGVTKAQTMILTIRDELAKNTTKRLDLEGAYVPFLRTACDKWTNQFADLKIRFLPPITSGPTNTNPNNHNVLFHNQFIDRAILFTGPKELVEDACHHLEALYREKKATCTQFHYPLARQKHRFVAGRNGCHIAQILNTTGCLLIFPDDNNAKNNNNNSRPSTPESNNMNHKMPSLQLIPSNPDEIVIFGPAKAHGYVITMIAEKADSMIEEHIEIPRWIHRHLTKNQRASLKPIQDLCPKIDFEFKRDSDDITLVGPPEQVQKAFLLLRGIVKGIKDRYKVQEIPVDAKLHPHIVGKAGSTINKIKDQSGVENIKVPGDKGPNYIQLEGTPESIALALREILEIVNKKENEMMIEIDINPKHIPLIIGTNGETIKEIRETYGEEVVIILPQRDNNNGGNKAYQKIRIRGSKQAVIDCANHIEMLKKSFAQYSFLDVPYTRDVYTVSPITFNRWKRYLRQSYPNFEFKFPEPDAKLIKRFKGNKDTLGSQDTLNDHNEAHHKLTTTKSERRKAKVTATTTSANTSSPSTTNTGKETMPSLQTFTVRTGSKTESDHFLQSYPDCLAEYPITQNMTASDRSQLIKGCEEIGAICKYPAREDKMAQDMCFLFARKPLITLAKKYIENYFTELKERVTIFVEVDSQYCPLILGAKGTRLANICNEFAVKIHVPDLRKKGGKRINDTPNGDHHEESNNAEETDGYNVEANEHIDTTINKMKIPKSIPCQIEISGRPGNCELAKQAILDQLPHTETISMSRNMWNKLNKPSLGLKSLFKSISFNIKSDKSQSNAAEPTVAINLRGNHGEVIKATKWITEQMQTLEKNDPNQIFKITHHMDIPIAFKGQIIGKGGQEINGLCSKYNVRILFPPLNTNANRNKIRNNRKKESSPEKQSSPSENDTEIICNGNNSSEHEDGFENNAALTANCQVTIMGVDQNSIDAVCKELEEKLEALQNNYEDKIDVETSLIPRFIGAGGRQIRKTMSDFGVNITTRRKNDGGIDGSFTTFIIRGSIENVSKSKTYIQNQRLEYLTTESKNVTNGKQPNTNSNRKPAANKPPFFPSNGFAGSMGSNSINFNAYLDSSLAN